MSAETPEALSPPRRALASAIQLLAPGFHIGRRIVEGRFWHEHQREAPGSGPEIDVDEANVIDTEDGVGSLFERTYRVTIADAGCSAEDLMTAFRTEPNRFSPTSYATFVPTPGPDGMNVDEDYEVALPGPWSGPIRVGAVTPTSICFNTLDGHMEAGAIEFRTFERGEGRVEFRIRSQARSSTPVVDTLYSKLRVAKLVQSQMWAQVLEAAVESCGGRQEGRLEFETVSYEEEID